MRDSLEEARLLVLTLRCPTWWDFLSKIHAQVAGKLLFSLSQGYNTVGKVEELKRTVSLSWVYNLDGHSYYEKNRSQYQLLYQKFIVNNDRALAEKKLIKKIRADYLKLIDSAVSAGGTACNSVKCLIAHLMRKGKEVNPFFQDNLSSENWAASLGMFEIKYSLLWYFGLANKWTKYHFPSIFSRGTGQEVPPSFMNEKPGHFLSGVGYCFVRWCIKNGLEYVLPWLKAKKGMPAVHPCLLHSGTVDLYQTLGKEHKLKLNQYQTCIPLLRNPDDFINLEYRDRLFVLSREVDRTARELFRGKVCDIRTLLPSVSAHFESGRKSGGAMGVVGDIFTAVARENVEKKVRARCEISSYDAKGDEAPSRVRPVPEFIQLKYSRIKACGCWCHSTLLDFHCDCTGYSKDLPYFGRSSGRFQKCSHFRNYVEQSQFEFISQDSSWVRAAVSDMVNRCIHLFNNCNYDGDEESERERDTVVVCDDPKVSEELDTSLNLFDHDSLSNMVQPVALPEPDKVRMITAGPALRYWFARGLQRVTHSVLREHPVFRLIGEPLTEEHIRRLGFLGSDEAYLSGDYKSATDLLHPDLSISAVEAISDCLGLDAGLRKLYKDALVGAVVAGSPSCGIPDTPQVWGQLMGSPLSFPILCVVNAAMNRFAMELCPSLSLMRDGIDDIIRSSGKELLDNGRVLIRLDRLPLLINGDDVAARICVDSYPLWKHIVSDAGLVPSVGKNYLSEDFVIINSTCFAPSPILFDRAGELREVPCLNLGLLCPQRGAKWESVNTDFVSLDPMVSDLSAISHTLVKGFDWDEKDRLMSTFLGQGLVKELLAKVKPGVSLFASKSLGGIGLYASRTGLMTKEQLGYYTRVAGTRGEIAPLFPLITNYDASRNTSLMRYTESEVVWEDWFQSSEPMMRSGFGLRDYDYWRAIWRLSCVEGSVSQSIEALTAENPVTGESGPWGLPATFVPEIVDRELFRVHKSPWLETSLTGFPWRKAGVEVSNHVGHTWNVIIS